MGRRQLPANFTIEVCTGSAWEMVDTRTNCPRLTTGSGQAFTFPARTTNRVRVVGTGQGLIQFAELEAYQQ